MRSPLMILLLVIALLAGCTTSTPTPIFKMGLTGSGEVHNVYRQRKWHSFRVIINERFKGLDRLSSTQ